MRSKNLHDIKGNHNTPSKVLRTFIRCTNTNAEGRKQYENKEKKWEPIRNFLKHSTKMRNFSGKYSEICTAKNKLNFNKVEQSRVD